VYASPASLFVSLLLRGCSCGAGTYEDDIKIKNKHVEGISMTFYLSIETISRPPQSSATIPLNPLFVLQYNL
jgi:hypothetical protein